jgi:hypothetical protein
MDSSNSSSGHPVRRLRLTLDMSLRRCALLSQLDFRRLSIIERGLTYEEVQRLAKVLGCEPGELVSTGEETKRQRVQR